MSLLGLNLDASGFPPGANQSDTEIFGAHFNLTTLKHFNYTLYPDNNTVSNWTKCYLVDPPYTPVRLLNNGTWVNATWCYSATLQSGPRAHIGVGFAVAFGLSLVFVLVNLGRHGRLHLPAEKRFYAIGRRWQWYWAILMCAMAIIGLFTNIDVDRYRVVELPLILNVFFWFLMQLGTTALVWEAVRHWGSWMERQFIDPNPFVLQETDRRGMFEFWLPLFFYAWWWLNFFLIIPRNWGPIELQRSPQQTVARAIPAATDGRFKAAPFCLFVCWCTILVSLWHSIRHYEPRNRGWFNRLAGFIGYIPLRFVLEVPLLLALIAYQALSFWEFDLSPLKAKTNLLAMYLGGYAPSLLILIIQIADGFLRPNEDRELIRQRRQRGAEIDRDLGLVKKPAWWRRVNREHEHETANMRDRIMRNVQEVGGGRATARQIERLAARRAPDANADASDDNIEMGAVRTASGVSSVRGVAPPSYTESAHPGKSDRRRNEQTVRAAASLLFPYGEDNAASNGNGDRGRNAGVASQRPQQQSEANGGRSYSNASAVSQSGPPQQVRSMLDV
ncbi:hypothetical protein GGR56DRAFT_694910 [Xylariaceae sp. FL0804]|nr:hypothetical protein GGR56DRAFT_694910 [Xylariaceae sp. FL0804]